MGRDWRITPAPKGNKNWVKVGDRLKGKSGRQGGCRVGVLSQVAAKGFAEWTGSHVVVKGFAEWTGTHTWLSRGLLECGCQGVYWSVVVKGFTGVDGYSQVVVVRSKEHGVILVAKDGARRDWAARRESADVRLLHGMAWQGGGKAAGVGSLSEPGG
jgi:hypothetical protein